MKIRVTILPMRTKIIAVVAASLIMAASVAYLAEAGQGGGTIKASGVLEYEKVAVSVPSELALLGVDMSKASSSSNGSSSNTSKLLKPVGVAENLNIEDGSKVKHGDVLLSVGEEMANKNLKKAQAQYDIVSATVDGLTESRNDLSNKRSDLNKTEADLRASRAKAISNFNKSYSEGQANIKQMQDQLVVLKAHGGNPAQIARFEAAIEQASAGLAAGKQQFDAGLARMNRGLKKISSGKNQIDEGDTKLARKVAILEKRKTQAEVGLQLARDILDATKIRATGSGIVAELKVDEGSVLYPGQQLMSIIRTDKLKLDIYIPLEKVKQVKKGDPVKVTVDASPEEIFRGNVTEISGKAIFAPSNITTDELELLRVIKVTVEVDNKDGILKAGMPADIRINVHFGDWEKIPRL